MSLVSIILLFFKKCLTVAFKDGGIFYNYIYMCILTSFFFSNYVQFMLNSLGTNGRYKLTKGRGRSSNHQTTSLTCKCDVVHRCPLLHISARNENQTFFSLLLLILGLTYIKSSISG